LSIGVICSKPARKLTKGVVFLLCAVVAVDGVHFDTISSPHVNFVTLHRMPAGQHTVRVSLHDQTNEHILASNEAEFTVLRPEVTLMSAYVEMEKGRTRVIVRV